MNDAINMVFPPRLLERVVMTKEQRDAALNDKPFWESIENTWRGNGIDFVVRAVLSGRTNEFIYGQMEFAGMSTPCDRHKQSCFRAFDYIRALNWIAIL